jgi:hypothetical protein
MLLPAACSRRMRSIMPVLPQSDLGALADDPALVFGKALNMITITVSGEDFTPISDPPPGHGLRECFVYVL